MSKSSNLLKGLTLNNANDKKEEILNAPEEKNKNIEDAMDEVSGRVVSSISFENPEESKDTLLSKEEIQSIKTEKANTKNKRNTAKKAPKNEVKVQEVEVPLRDYRKGTGGAPGLTPTIDGEAFTIKRTYQFRESTLRKLSILKANHPDINVYLNTIIDDAINFYYDEKMKK